MESKHSKLHQDSVHLSQNNAENYLWHLVTGWTFLEDTWALRFGPGILGGLSGINGLIINSHYRTRLRLGSIGRPSTLLPIVFLPGTFIAFFHRHFVSSHILLRKKQSCFICYETRSAVLQCVFGIGYPMVMGPLTTLMLANRYSTYRVPSMTQEPKQVWHFLKKISKSLGGTLTFLALINIVASSVITYFEVRNQINFHAKLEDIERKLESKTVNDHDHIIINSD